MPLDVMAVVLFAALLHAGWNALVRSSQDTFADTAFMVGGAALVRQQQRQAEMERNKQQLIVALQITSSKLSRVQDRLSVIQERINRLQLQQQ